MTGPACAVCRRPGDPGALLRVVPRNGEHDWHVCRPSVSASCFRAVAPASLAMIEIDQAEADRWDAGAGGASTWAADAASARRAHDIARQVGGYDGGGA